MADLATNINQAISDFGTIKQAIINKGIEVPNGTKTSEYGNLINSINEKIVNQLILFEGTDEGYSLADGFTGFSQYSQAGADIAITKRIDTTDESQYGYRIAKSWSIDGEKANYTDSVIISSNELVDLTNYNTVCIDFYGYCDYRTSNMSDANDMAAYFRVDLPKTLPQSKVAYDWTEWDNMGMNYHKRGKYYFDVSHLTGKHDLCFGIFHGTYDIGYTNGIKIYKMTLM